MACLAHRSNEGPGPGAPRERCPAYVGPDQWPRFHGGKKGKLAGALGSECHACGDVTGSFIDHDHFTGYVRGLLCKGCNHMVDMCPHPSGCVYAGNLNDPPASPLRLKYPMDRTLNDAGCRLAGSGEARRLKRTTRLPRCVTGLGALHRGCVSYGTICHGGRGAGCGCGPAQAVLATRRARINAGIRRRGLCRGP